MTITLDGDTLSATVTAVKGKKVTLTLEPEKGGDTAAPKPNAPASPSAPANPGTPGTPSTTAPDTTTAPGETQAPGSPAPAPSVAPTADTGTQTAGTEVQQVLALVNQDRAQVGCQPLVEDPAMAAVAQAHAKDMAARGFFAHDNPDGLSPFDRGDAAGVKITAENIAQGQETPEKVVAVWLGSAGHKENIENCALTTVGTGYVAGSNEWVQDFGPGAGGGQPSGAPASSAPEGNTGT